VLAVGGLSGLLVYDLVRRSRDGSVKGSSRLVINSARQAVFWIADRSALIRRLLYAGLAWYMRAKGGNRAVLDEALEDVDSRPALRTAEMMMWSRAVEGRGRFPRYFPADRMIKTPEAKVASVAGLKRHLAAHKGYAGVLASTRFLLDTQPILEDARSFVEEDLRDRLRRKAVTPRGLVPVDRERQIAVLSDVIGALEQADLRPFLVSGTLLGHVRSGELMAHDYDIDLGILPGEADAARVVSAFSDLADYSIVAQELKVVANHVSGFGADVFIHYERDGLLWHGTDIHEWWNTPFGLDRDSLHGIDVWVPNDAGRYLDENYGTWQRPIAFYNFSFDTPNRRYRTTVDALTYLYRRCLQAIERNDRWTAESAIRELRDHFDIDLTHEVQPTALLMTSSTQQPGG
jgi:hypothetical protein